MSSQANEEKYVLRSFTDYKKDLKQKILDNMTTLESLSPNAKEHHEILLNTLDKLFSYSFYEDIEDLKPIEFLKKYDSFLSDSEVVKAYFSLNTYSYALEYIKFNYERLKNGFKSGFVAFNSVDDEGEFGTPIEFDYYFEIKYVYGIETSESNIHIIPQGYNERTLNYLLYKYFYDDISFIFIKAKTKNDKLYGFCHSLDWIYLKEILLDYYNKKDYKTFDEITRKYVSKSIYIDDLLKILEPPFDDINFICFSYLDYIKTTPILLYYPVPKSLAEYEDKVRKIVIPSKEVAGYLICNNFYANLEYLKALPKKERGNTSVYKDCFQVFFDFFKEFYDFDITEYEYMFKRLFNRIIEGASIINLLTLANIESLYHYFKSGELLNLDNDVVSLDDIKEYNTKHFFEIRGLIYSQAMAILFYDEHSFSEDAISVLKFYGYDFAKKLLKLKISKTLLIQISKHKFKDEIAKNKFLTLILNEIFKSQISPQEIDKVLKIFDYLYDNGYENITLAKIKKRINSFDHVLLPNNLNIKNNLRELDKVSKGEPISEKINGINLYNEYRFRSISSIPDIQGEYQGLTFETVDMHSPEIISNGIGAYLHSNGETASSCLTPNGKAASCLTHGATSPHGRFFKVTINGQILAYSWIWRAGNTLCFDNIEVTNIMKKNNIAESTIFELYKKAGEEFIRITRNNEQNPLEVILIGKNKLDVIQTPFNELSKTKEQIKPNYSNELYLKDSEDGEYILIGDEVNINTSDVTPIYKYKRIPVIEFSSVDRESLNARINSIYFDYCICANEKYTPKENNYTKGFIGEDWYVGYLEDGREEFYYRTVNSDITNEAKKYLNRNIDIKLAIPIIKGDYKELDHFLNVDNYEYNEKEVLEYLKSIEEYFKQISTNDYFHTPKSMKNLGRILYDGAITSSIYGKHPGGIGSNGGHFVCVAEINSSLYEKFSSSRGFIIDENICTFKTAVASAPDFSNSRYPIRNEGGEGEKQVLDYIPLSKVKTIKLTEGLDIGKTTYIEEHLGLDIPIVFGSKYRLVDRNEIKRLIKLKI